MRMGCSTPNNGRCSVLNGLTPPPKRACRDPSGVAGNNTVFSSCLHSRFVRLRVIRNDWGRGMLSRMMLLLILLFGATIASSARADDPPEIAVTFFGDRFEPVDIVVPIGLKFALKVTNKTSAAMEWES